MDELTERHTKAAEDHSVKLEGALATAAQSEQMLAETEVKRSELAATHAELQGSMEELTDRHTKSVEVHNGTLATAAHTEQMLAETEAKRSELAATHAELQESMEELTDRHTKAVAEHSVELEGALATSAQTEQLLTDERVAKAQLGDKLKETSAILKAAREKCTVQLQQLVNRIREHASSAGTGVVFAKWRGVAATARSARHHDEFIETAVARMRNTVVRRMLVRNVSDWVTFAESRHAKRTLLCSIALRKDAACLAGAWGALVAHCRQHRQLLRATERISHRSVDSGWASWVSFVAASVRARTIIARSRQRWSSHAMQQFWNRWRAHVNVRAQQRRASLRRTAALKRLSQRAELRWKTAFFRAIETHASRVHLERQTQCSLDAQVASMSMRAALRTTRESFRAFRFAVQHACSERRATTKVVSSLVRIYRNAKLQRTREAFRAIDARSRKAQRQRQVL
jgi:hypothetical protein